MAQNRPDLVASAVTFLRDPSVADSPVASRLSFLEAKGLTPAEIDEAFRTTYGSSPGNTASSSDLAAAVQPHSRMFSQSYPPPAYRGTPNFASTSQVFDERGRDWRDWFIMTVVGGTVGYFLVSMARKYLMPALSPPSETEVSQIQDALTAKYDEAAALLESLQEDTKVIRNDMDAQKEKVQETLEDIKSVVEDERQALGKRNLEMERIKNEVDSIKENLPKMIEKGKEAQTAVVAELQNEIKSLSTLLVSRRADSSTSGAENGNPDSSQTNSSSNRLFPRTPGLPAWQLQSSSPSSTTPPAATSPKVPVPNEPETSASTTEVATESSSSDAKVPSISDAQT